MSIARWADVLTAAVTLLAAVAGPTAERAWAQTPSTQTIVPGGTAMLNWSAGARYGIVTVVNETPQSLDAVVDGSILIVTEAADVSIILTALCDHVDSQPNTLHCDFAAPSVAGSSNFYVSVVNAYGRAVCPPAGTCTVQVSAGQTVTLGSFGVTNLGDALTPGQGVLKVTYDGMTLRVSGGAPADSVPGCLNVNGVPGETQCANPHGALAFHSGGPPNPAGAYCGGYDAPAGWNLLPGTVARYVNLNVGPLYTYRAGDENYKAVQPGFDLSLDGGYWVLFAAPTKVYRGCVLPPFLGPRPAPVVVNVGPGWTMLGDPLNNVAVSVSGVDALYGYDAMTGYQEATSLGAGEAAWVYSGTGTTLTLTPALPSP